MTKLKNRLRSRAGASISYALLLFLVCAVLCSVILAAATAAAGRMSKTAELDQRYYAVSSAAELLKDLVNGKTVSIVEFSSSSTYYLVEKPADQIRESNYSSYSDSADSLIKDAANHVRTADAASFSQELSLASNLSPDPLAVTVTETISPDGSLRFAVKNTAGEPFTLTLSFGVDRSVSQRTKTVDGTSTRTKITTLTWHLTGIETGA